MNAPKGLSSNTLTKRLRVCKTLLFQPQSLRAAPRSNGPKGWPIGS